MQVNDKLIHKFIESVNWDKVKKILTFGEKLMMFGIQLDIVKDWLDLRSEN